MNVIELQDALLEALQSERIVSKPAGDKPGERAITLRLRGEEGKPPWIEGVHVKKDDFRGSEAEAPTFIEDATIALARVYEQLDLQAKMKIEFGL